MILAGATLERPPGRKYVDALRFAELTFPSSLPKRATLARWRASLPPEMEVALVAPRSTRISALGAFRFDEELERSLAWYVSALEATNAHAVVPTGAELSTSKRDRERFAAWVARLPRREERHVVWAPSGIWESELAQPFAAELGLLCAFDPLQDDVLPSGPVGYVRLQALGGRQRFGEGLLSEVLDALEESTLEKTYVAIESGRSFREAKLLQELAGEASSGHDEDLDDEDLDDEDLDDEDLDDGA